MMHMPSVRYMNIVFSLSRPTAGDVFIGLIFDSIIFNNHISLKPRFVRIIPRSSV